jgi:hypothetical protein
MNKKGMWSLVVNVKVAIKDLIFSNNMIEIVEYRDVFIPTHNE